MKSPQALIYLLSFSRISIYGLAIICLTSATVSALYGGNETDYLALLSFKSKITHDPYKVLTSWNHSFYLYDWTGISCGRRHKRVNAILLYSYGLEGLLSPHVGNLSFLRRLYLWNNSFQGTIPPELGHLSRLRHLILYDNKLSGVIPKEISFLSKLKILQISDNKLEGGIPPSMGNITSLEVFTASRNPLGGSIPDTLGHLNSLIVFYSCDYNLYGSIPPSIYNLSLLVNISLAHTYLTGSLPSEIGVMLPNLKLLRLTNNQLTGVLPPSLLQSVGPLSMIDLGTNNFHGTIPNVYGECGYLEGLILNGNQLEGEVPYSLSECRSLKVLDIGNNQLNGTFPEWLGGLSELQVLVLRSNKFHGPIKTSTVMELAFSSLQVLDLSHNRCIPNALGNMLGIESLDLSRNQLIGEIPQSLAGITGLSALNLSQNHLEGRILQGKQFNKFDVRSYGGNLGLCGFPLSNKCEHLSSVHVFGDGDDEESDEIGCTWKVVMLGYGCGILVGLVMGNIMLSTRKVKWFNAIANATESLVLKKKRRRLVCFFT
ncbi:kinase-like domain-containing protein [Tanacetum coccineum]